MAERKGHDTIATRFILTTRYKRGIPSAVSPLFSGVPTYNMSAYLPLLCCGVILR